MLTLRYWFRPAILVSLWMLAAAFTLSELATVAPLLGSLGGEPAAVRGLRPTALRARTYALTGRTFAP